MTHLNHLLARRLRPACPKVPYLALGALVQLAVALLGYTRRQRHGKDVAERGIQDALDARLADGLHCVQEGRDLLFAMQVREELAEDCAVPYGHAQRVDGAGLAFRKNE